MDDWYLLPCLSFTNAAGRLKMHDLKMQDWKMTDNILANCEQNYGVWKMQDWKMTDHVNYRLCFLLTFLTDDIRGGF